MTYLFSDIEGSTRLWETDPDRIGPALARHDALAREIVLRHGGRVVKMTGDGLHAAFDDASAALHAVVEIQSAVALPPDGMLPLAVRCGLHAGIDQQRDGDYYGQAVNRAARVMQAAHGGQILLSQAVAERSAGRLPAGCALHDLGQVRLRDLTMPERVYQLQHPQLRSEFPPLRSLASTPNNLPQQVNTFIGRERELNEVRTLLAMPTVRLLTLLGMGGLGKTRLSLQVAAEVLDEYPDGVWFVELAPITDARSVPQALASLLGVKEDAAGSLQDALLRYLRDKNVLIVLDNCEHVVQACAELTRQVLQFAPTVKLLASSRDALQTAGETVVYVQPLTAPDAGATITPAALAQIDAARLFIDRATAVQPAFRVTDKNAAAVAAICRRLDGIPLALELAAARTRALSVEAIAAWLDDRFKLLVNGERTVLPRQRTLRALIDWSYDLLSPPERTLFARLSVFAGGWTLEAAETVVQGGEIDHADVLDLLAQLVEKSLVMADVNGGRYRMLETVREYARERLLASGDGNEVRTRHLTCFVDLVEAARPHLSGPQQGAWLERLDLERENITAAHEWSNADPSRRAVKSQFVRSLRLYFFNRGLYSTARALFANVLADLTEPGVERCRVLFFMGQSCYYMGQYGDARGYLEQCLQDAQHTGDEAVQQPARALLGLVCLGESDLASARAYLAPALEFARTNSTQRELAAMLSAVAQLHRAEGRTDLAQTSTLEGLALARQVGDHETVGRCLLNLSMIAVDDECFDVAAAYLREAIAVATQIGSKVITQTALDVCAGMLSATRRWETAAHLFAVGEHQRAELGIRRDAPDEAFVAVHSQRVREALGPAGHERAAREAVGTTIEQALVTAATLLDSFSTGAESTADQASDG